MRTDLAGQWLLHLIMRSQRLVRVEVARHPLESESQRCQWQSHEARIQQFASRRPSARSESGPSTLVAQLADCSSGWVVEAEDQKSLELMQSVVVAVDHSLAAQHGPVESDGRSHH